MFQIGEQAKNNEFRYFIQSKLYSLWRNQLVINQEQPLIPLELHTRKAIFNWFKHTLEFRTCYADAINYVLKPPSEEELKLIKQDFAGRMHQYIAYNIMAAEAQYEGNLLLNPLNTLILYEALFFAGSINNRISHLFGDIGLNHISVPDGLALQQVGKEIKIKEIIEYTLSGNYEKFHRRLTGFLTDRRKYPELFVQTTLRFVVPLTDHHQRYRDDMPSNIVNFSEIPINHNQYRNFSNGIFYRYRLPILHADEVRHGEENPTLMELLQWAQARKHA